LDREGTREQTRAEIQTRYAAIQQLTQEGMSISARARAFKLHRHTVQKYRNCTSPPQRRHTARQTSALTPYQGYLVERWRSDCHNAQLWRKRAGSGPAAGHGGDGGDDSSAGSGTCRRAIGAADDDGATNVPWSNSALHPEIQTVLTLVTSFATLIRERSDSHPQPTRQLEQWLAQATASRVKELKASATKLRQDAEAVLAALTLSYSQGQTQGQVNRLKLLKRSMYGRAKFDLLCGRILYASAMAR
jgi:transposase